MFTVSKLKKKKRTDNERLKNLRIQNSQTGYDELDTHWKIYAVMPIMVMVIAASDAFFLTLLRQI